MTSIPSWSWASLAGGYVELHRHLQNAEGIEHDLELIQVSSTHVSLASADPFGQVSGGRIELSGYIMTARWSAVSDWESRCRARAQDGSEESLASLERDIYLVKDGDRYDRNEIYCLPIIKGDVKVYDKMRATVQGLMMEPTGHAPGEYRRLGSFVLPVDDGELWPSALRVTSNDVLKSEEYVTYESSEESNGGGIEGKYRRYSITLV